jgi:hypothetical protein
MKPLFIEPTEFTPKIYYDIEKHFMEISGFSRPEDVRGYYQKFFDWLENNKSDILNAIRGNAKLKIEFKLVYFNSASSKCLLDMVLSLNKLYSHNLDTLNEHNIDAIWYYEEGDEDMLEAGEEFSDAVEIPFSYVQIEER